MLLLLIAAPVVMLAALTHSMLQAYAPSNVLIRHVRATRPTLRMAVALGALAFGCALAVHTVDRAIEAGAPGWLNLVGLVLAWDAIKFAVMACLSSVRRVASAIGGLRPPHGRPAYP
jgi:hypothetical protein